MRKLLIIASILLLICLFAACSKNNDDNNHSQESTQSIEETSIPDTDKTSDITDTNTSCNTTEAYIEESSVESTKENTEINTEENSSEDYTYEIPPTEGNINPQFSHTGGIYESSITLELSFPANVDGYSIRYTTDGSLPTKSSQLYSSPIKLDKSMKSCVIRAACFKGNLPSGKVITHTYIFDKKATSSLWTVSITAESDELEYIMQNFSLSLEIPSHTEIITPDGKTVISQDTGLKMFGGSSRSHAQKSFKIIARKSDRLGSDLYIGKGSFSYPLFADRTIKLGKGAGQVLQKYDSFILRNGGNDSLNAITADPLKPSLLRDNISNTFAAKTLSSFDMSYSQFASVYVNGEYYGILDMRENMNEDYVKNIYGVDDENVVVVKSELDTTRTCGKWHAGDCRFCGCWFYYETDAEYTSEMNAWIKLCQEAINCTSANYDTMYRKIAAKVDLDSFAEYMALNIYLCNSDWPHNNVKIWRYTGARIDGIEITDGKWRFMYRDMDFTFGRYECNVLPEVYTQASLDMFYRTLGNYKNFGISNSGNNKLYPDALYLQGLFDFCLKNESFRNKFISICENLASKDSTAALKNCYYTAFTTVKTEIAKHIKRWQNTIDPSMTPQLWATSAKNILEFIDDRPTYFLAQLDKAMGLYE